MTDEDEEEKEGEVFFLGPPPAEDKPRMTIGARVECDDPEMKARLQALVNRHLGTPPPEEDPPEEKGHEP